MKATTKEVSNIYNNVPDELKDLSKEELAIMIHGFYGMILSAEIEWEYRPKDRHANLWAEFPVISKIASALKDYRNLSYFEDCRWQLEVKTKEQLGDGMGCVYVAEFSDGSVKIGKSINPLARLKSLAGGNQATMLRSWATARLPNAYKLENAAHKEFASVRLGGEFFKASFDEVVAWIEPISVEWLARSKDAT